MVAGSKYVKHLTRTFKKKYRPPKKNEDGKLYNKFAYLITYGMYYNDLHND